MNLFPYSKLSGGQRRSLVRSVSRTLQPTSVPSAIEKIAATLDRVGDLLADRLQEALCPAGHREARIASTTSTVDTTAA